MIRASIHQIFSILGVSLLTLVLVVPANVWADEDGPDPQPALEGKVHQILTSPIRCAKWFASLSFKGKLGVTAVAAAVAAPTLYFAPAYKGPLAALQGKEHVGWGIMLDREGIKAQLSLEERKLLDDPSENALAIVKLFASKLDSELEDPNYTKYSNLRNASSLMEEGNEHRGRPRHKAVALWAILNDLGIKANLQMAYRPVSRNRRYLVDIPSEKVLVDFNIKGRTKGKVIRSADFYWATAAELDDPIKLTIPHYEPSLRDHR